MVVIPIQPKEKRSMDYMDIVRSADPEIFAAM